MRAFKRRVNEAKRRKRRKLDDSCNGLDRLTVVHRETTAESRSSGIDNIRTPAEVEQLIDEALQELTDSIAKSNDPIAIKSMTSNLHSNFGQRVKNPCFFVDRTDTLPHKSKTHEAGIRHLQELHNTVLTDKSFWREPSNPPNCEHRKNKWNYRRAVEINSEGDVVVHMVTLIKEILRAKSLDYDVDVLVNRQVAGVEIDILLVHRSRNMPFLAIEVKKPGRKVTEKGFSSVDPTTGYTFFGTDETEVFSSKGDNQKDAGCVLGQHRDQLNALELFGTSQAYGAITTGNTIAFTQNRPDGFLLPYYNNEEEQEQVVVANKNAPTTKPAKGSFTPSTQSTSSQSNPITTSQPISYLREPALYISTLTNWIILAYKSLERESPKTISNQRACRQLIIDLDNPHGNQKTTPNTAMVAFKLLNMGKWGTKRFYKQTVNDWNLSNFVTFNTNDLKIFLFYSLKMGSTGDCCLAMTKEANNKQFCVVKFFRTYDDERGGFLRPDEVKSAAETERDNWITIYPEFQENVYLGTPYEGKAFLCMPFLIPIEEEKERQELLDNGSLHRALDEFSKGGYIHNEAKKWEHVGTWNEKVYFLDLGKNSVEKVDPNEHQRIKEWKDGCLSQLQRTISDEMKIDH